LYGIHVHILIERPPSDDWSRRLDHHILAEEYVRGQAVAGPTQGRVDRLTEQQDGIAQAERAWPER
jgi:hypothetical protein